MAKICSACGAELSEAILPANEPEDCPQCGGIETASEAPATEKKSTP
jgi:Zn-finger nucleic acid-binding protein